MERGVVLCSRSEVSKELQNEYLDTLDLEKYDIFREAKKKKRINDQHATDHNEISDVITHYSAAP
jgi:uncharacterized protein YllA (UPF0747 family)